MSAPTGAAAFTAGITVLVQRQAEDAFGNFATVAEHRVGPCGFDPTGSSELSEGGRDTVTRRATLYAPPGADIAPTDRIVIEGRRWQVVGAPAPFASPFTGWAPGMTVTLELVSG